MANLKRYLKVGLFALIGVAILWYITKGQDVDRIWQEFREARLLWVLLAMIASVISHYLRAIRWNLMIRSMNYPTRTSITFYAVMTGYLANLAVPRLGEVTRCGTLSKYSKVPFNALAGTVVAERVFDMVSLLVLIFLTIVFQFSFLKEFLEYNVFSNLRQMIDGNLYILVILAVAGVAGLYLLRLYFRKVGNDRTSFSGKVKRQLLGFWKGILSLAFIKDKMMFLFYSFLMWVCYFLTVYLVFFAIDATSILGVGDGITVLALGSLGIVAPVPGGIGAYHFIVIKTLTELFGIQTEPATSYAYLAHAAQTVVVLILGGISWIALSAKLKTPSQVNLSPVEVTEK